MAQCSITVKVKLAWWVVPYIQSLALFARLTGMEPDAGKVLTMVIRGISVKA